MAVIMIVKQNENFVPFKDQKQVPSLDPNLDHHAIGQGRCYQETDNQSRSTSPGCRKKTTEFVDQDPKSECIDCFID